jgi:hypothetical protein
MMPLRLDPHCLVEGTGELDLGVLGAQRSPQVDLFFLAEAR